MNKNQIQTGMVLKGLLILFSMAYALGEFYFLLGWLELQNMPSTWQQASLPFYAYVFALITASVRNAIRWKRWVVYGLVITWAGTIILNVLFPIPAHTLTSLVAVILVIIFVSQVLRVWSRFL